MIEAPRQPQELPTSFGRYRLLKLLGKGGMGSVYLAHDTQLDRPVALKIPLLNDDDNAEMRARFYREARSAAAVHHPNICPIHDVGEIDGLPYLTMAYLEGKPLSQFVRLRPLLPRQSAMLVRKLALALQEAHKRDVIHRDLKPANIMIDKRGEPLIMDFGLARRARSGDPRLTQEGRTMGTPAYMPPEQVSGKVDAMGPACDIYSLGVILYELLAGRIPFAGDDVMAMLSRVLLDEPDPPSQFRPDLDPELEAICLKAMAKKIEDRYPSMAELAGTLLEYLRKQAALSDRADPAVPPATRPATDPPVEKSEAEVNTPKGGLHVTDMGGLRSVAQLHAEIGNRSTGRKPPKGAARSTSKSARRKALPAWLWLGGLGGAGCLLLVGWLIYPATNEGSVFITLDDPKAAVEITIDKELKCQAGQPIVLAAGQHFAEVEGPDYWPVTHPFTIQRGTNPEQLIKLRPKYGSVHVRLSDPTAPVQVLIDGMTTSVTGLADLARLRVGEHTLRVFGTDYDTITRTFTIHGGENPAILIEHKPAVPDKAAPGLRAEIFQGKDFEHKVNVRIDPRLDNRWHVLSPPDKAIPPSSPFSIRWSGFLKAPRGQYKLIVQADDGVRLALDGKLLIDEWHPSPGYTYETPVTLTGKLQAIRIDYMEVGIENCVIKLQWQQKGGFATRVVGKAALFHAPATYEILKARLPEDDRKFFTAEPQNARDYLLRAHAYYHARKYEEALADFNQWAALDAQRPDAASDFPPEYYNSIAWQIATRSGQTRLSGTALAMAGKTCRLAPKNWMFVDTLAAALAFDGKFDKAAATEQAAIKLAPERDKGDCESRLQLYRESKPFQETPPRTVVKSLDRTPVTKKDRGPPITGTVGPRMKALDDFMLRYREKIGCTAAAVALGRNGTLWYSRGYGWTDQAKKLPTQPDTLFGIQGLPDAVLVTAAIRQLARSGRLHLSDPVFSILQTPREKVDPRIGGITVQKLLDQKLGPIISFDLLRQVITKVSGKSPANFYRKELLQLADSAGGIASPGSKEMNNATSAWNASRPWPLCASAPTLCSFMRQFRWDGELRNGSNPKTDQFILGPWAEGFSLMVWRPDGINAVVLFNGGNNVVITELGAELGKVIGGLAR